MSSSSEEPTPTSSPDRERLMAKRFAGRTVLHRRRSRALDHAAARAEARRQVRGLRHARRYHSRAASEQACITTARDSCRGSSCCSAPPAAASQLDDQRGQHGLHRRSDQPRHPARRPTSSCRGRDSRLALARAVGWRLRRAHPGLESRAASDRGAAHGSISTRTSPTSSKCAARGAAPRGQRLPDVAVADYVLRYGGLDGVERRTPCAGAGRRTGSRRGGRRF